MADPSSPTKSGAQEESGNVKVMVRVRPFNSREIAISEKKGERLQSVIRMRDQTCAVMEFTTDEKGFPIEKEREAFGFDECFWSLPMDQGFSSCPFADQQYVYERSGLLGLEAIFKGFNVCIFAYGQTGSGKTHSMLGTEEDPGISLRLTDDLFARIEQMKTTVVTTKVNVECMFFEVYNEKVRDLFNKKAKAGDEHAPKIRQHPVKGVFVEGLLRKDVTTAKTTKMLIDRGTKERAAAETKMNARSSRSHAIFQIQVTQLDAMKGTQKVATINLVDLAGSERTESAGTSGQMLKEGNAINLSLTALGNCIHALSEGKRPGYRDSKLTLLLQGSMTNGKVIMIAAVSPASICFEESMSTLRFAERIKLVKIKAKKNVTLDPVAEIKKEMEEMRKRMQQEIDDLRSSGATGGGTGTMTGADPEELARLKALLEEQAANEKALREDMEKQVKELATTEAERLANANKISEQWKKALGGATDENKEDIKDPHLLNLNPESRLAETLIYKLKKGTTTAGRANKESPPDLDFSGMGMVKGHCAFVWGGDKVTLKVTTPGARVLVNGKPIEDEVELKHNYRVWLGNNYAFRFAFPGHEDKGEKFDGEQKADYFYAEEEIAKEAAKSNADGQPSALNHKLSEALKKVEQANIIAGDLNRDCVFHPKIITNRVTGENQVVTYVVLPQGTLTWPWEKFNVRLVDMVKLWESWQYATNNDQQFEFPADQQNPFVDNDYQLVGEADVWLQPLANMIETTVEPPVLNVSGGKEGELGVTIAPLDEKGNEGPWEDDDNMDLDPFVESPEELKGKQIQFIVKVDQLRFDVDLSQGGRPKYRDTWVRYRLNPADHTEEFTETKHDESSRIDPKYDHAKKFKQMVDDDFLKHIQKGRITFQIWGKLIEDVPAGARAQRLPDGWKRVTAYQDPDGKLHLELPSEKK